MHGIFYLQLFTSFVVGGTAIAALGFAAEHANKIMAGLLISLPSTVVFSYIFIAWTVSPQAVAQAVPATVLTAGSIQAFAIAYAFLSRIPTPRRWQSMAISIAGALTAWFALSIPVALMQFHNLGLAFTWYAMALGVSYYVLTVKNHSDAEHLKLQYSALQKIGRGVFAGSVIALAVLLANVLNPFWGGIFSSFPAVFTSTFLIFHWYHGPSMVQKILKGVPFGSLVYVAFTCAAAYTYPTFGIILGTISAYLASIVVFFAVLHLRRKNQ